MTRGHEIRGEDCWRELGYQVEGGKGRKIYLKIIFESNLEIYVKIFNQCTYFGHILDIILNKAFLIKKKSMHKDFYSILTYDSKKYKTIELFNWDNGKIKHNI